jgi:hypothetical protein
VGKPAENAADVSLRLSLLDGQLAVCRLDPEANLPSWATSAPFFSMTRTAEELSVVCPEEVVPAGSVCEKGWRALGVEGPLDFSLVGVLSSLATPLSGNGVSIFAISTYLTDYLLVREDQLEAATSALREYGHTVR